MSAPTPIAIIGMACTFAQAPDLRTFWNNILAKVDAIGEPVPNWDAQRYLDAGRIKTQYGGYLKDLYRFDPRAFGIMPNSMDGGEPDQFLALKIAAEALADAGYLGPHADHTDTGVILGHSTYLHRGQVTVIQTDIVIDQTMALVEAAMPHLTAEQRAEMRAMLAKKVPPMNADTAPGLVPNVMTGRIANRLNLKGPNYLVDAACSSSLLAVGAAIDELRAGRSRMMLAGGVNASLPADVTTIFTQLGALSARGKVRPFEAGSDGTLLGEGLGVVVLKRLPDALADGDRVYGVIRGVGQSSDGRGTGLLAPSQDGETLAIRRTYAAAGVDPQSVGLVEAHGTGIPLGDRTEIASLKAAFGERSAPIGTKALGSVKSMISHCIPAAGVASLIKATLALHHRTLPPTLCDAVNPELGIEHTPFYVNTQTGPWMARLDEPRRAGVNAFGFGGTNSHAILEQAPPEARRPTRLTDWPAELCVFAADDDAGLVAALQTLRDGLTRNPSWRLAEVAAALAASAADGPHRLAIVAKDRAGLAKAIDQALKRLAEPATKASWTARGGVHYSRARESGQLAFLFPGEGSQYPEMFADLALCFEPIQQWLDFWHGLYDLPSGQTRTDIVFPSAEIDATRRRELEQRLHDMDVGSESVFIGGMAMHELLQALGVEADVMLGHSSGESAALGASGANPARTPAERAACIAKHYAVYERLLADDQIPTGALLAVGALPTDSVEAEIAAVPEVVVAMDNCANQMVLYGPPARIAEVQQRLTTQGAICMPLPFDRGYHTPAFTAAAEAFGQYYKDVKLGRPRVPMYSCASAGRFPETPAAVRKLAAAQWSAKVRFRETILRMHDDGVRLFVEVGPSAKLTAFVNDILIDREFTALSTNVRRRNGVEQLLAVLGQLWVLGRGPVLSRLFEGRRIDAIDLAGSPPPPHGVLLDNTLPMIRLDEADRARLAALAAPLPPPLSATQGSASPAVASPDPVPAAGVEPVADAVGDDPRAAVMADYFALMRGFLDHQSTLVASRPEGVMARAGDAGDAGIAVLPSPSADAVSTHVRPGFTPLLDEIVAHDDRHVVARCRVSLSNDAFIRDHVMSGPVSESDPSLFGLSCVPFTVSLEVMAEACALLAGRVDVKVIENVRTFDWVALDNGALEFEVQAEVADAAAARYTARVVTARGPVLMADFLFEAEPTLGPVAPLPEPRASCLNAPYLYATGMFHGPVFQSMRWVRGWDHAGIDVELSDVTLDGFFAPGQRPQLVLNPVLLDAMGQLVACWLVQYVGTEFHAFPSTIQRLELYEPCPADRAGIVMQMRQRPVDPAATDLAAPRVWQFDCVDGDGRVLMRGDQLVNLFFRVPTAYHEVRTDPQQGWFGAPLGESGDVLLWDVPMMGEDFLAQSGAICLRILAHAVLSAPEREAWQAVTGPLRKRREWLFGRAAIKEAVRAWVQARTGHLLYPSDIVVGHDALGAPFVQGAWTGTLCAAPAVSLSHNARHCIAAVAPAGQRIGVDMEESGRLKDPALLSQALAPEELSLVQGLHGDDLEHRQLLLWCAKEAAAKSLGSGLQGRPWDWRVSPVDAGYDAAVVTHGGSQVGVQWLNESGRVVALAGDGVSVDVLDWNEESRT